MHKPWHAPASGRERRRAIRTPVLLRVDYGEMTGLTADYITDIAEGGIFLRTDTRFEIGESVELVLSFPAVLEPTKVRCIVRWVSFQETVDGTRKQTGVGMEFAGDSAQEAARLEPLLSILREQQVRVARDSTQNLTVLFVDDNKFVSELFKHAVRRFERMAMPTAEVRVLAATSATEALRFLDEEQVPDLIVVDHFMPGISGVELVRKLRAEERFAELPILMVSVGGPKVKEEAFAAGVTLFVDKPVLLTQLIETMRVLLARQELQP